MKGCLLRVALLPLIVAALYPLLSLRSPWPTFVLQAEGAGLAAGLAGLLFWFAVMSVLDGRQIRKDLALVAQTRARGFRDGERVVVHGTLEARGPLLAAPFSGEDCVGYYYKVDHHNHTMKTRQVDYEGWALTESLILWPTGSLNVLGPPNKELFYELPSEHLSSEDAAARVESYLAGAGLGDPDDSSRSVRKQERVTGPGSFRVDTRSGAQKALRDCDLSQKVVRSGDEVSLAGVFSEEGAGIAPDPDSIMRPMHIVPGGEATLRRKVRSRRVGAIVATLLGLTAVAVYLLVVARLP